MKRTILAAALVLAPHVADASYCIRPSRPSCVNFLSLTDSFSFDNCRTELVRYQRNVREFLECSRNEQVEVTDELNAAVRKFNACASDRYC